MHLLRYFAAALCVSLSPLASAATFLIDPQFGVSITNNVTYGTSANGAGTPLPRLLDIYQPVGPGLPDKLPGVVLMHGGFFTSGSKAGMSNIAQAWASRGYVAVSINYRLLFELPDPPGAPPTVYPSRVPAWVPGQLAQYGVTIQQYANTIAAAVADQGMAVNWLADNAATYQLDPHMIVVGGYSAGAVSSQLLGIGAVDGVDADVAAVASFAGGTFGHEIALDSNDPPMFLVHGTDDTTVPYSEYLFMQPALDNAGVPSEAMILPGVGHGLGFNEMTSTQMFRFLKFHVVPEPSAATFAALSAGIFSMQRRRRVQLL